MPEKTVSRVIIDTNILISSLMSKEVSRLNKILAEERVIVVFSRESWEEFFSVVKRPKFKKYFDKDKVSTLVSLLSHISEFVKVASSVTICRDEKDNFLLELSKDSKANYIITGDLDLLILAKFGKTQIITFNQFLKIVNV